MLVVFFYVMVKMLELSSGHVTMAANGEATKRRRKRRSAMQRRRRGPARAAAGSPMDEGGVATTGARSATASPPPPPGNSPDHDCNSNATGATTRSFASEASASLPDADFVQECQDYQWFPDYGPQGPGAGLLSSLTASSQCGAAPAYEDLARDLDANLAEVDMEDFRSEDIHSVLSTLPAMCCHADMQADDSAGSTDTMSLCKSELLFSPVKECPLPSSNFSVDSLDCDLLTEHDIMLTCQANKDNYTIAFEGSVALYSEDSDYHEPDLDGTGNHNNNNYANNNMSAWGGGRLVRLGTAGGRGTRALDTSMARSDSVYTTWSKLQKRSSELQLSRLRGVASAASTGAVSAAVAAANAAPSTPAAAAAAAAALKSQSLPNLSRARRRRRCVFSALAPSAAMSCSSVESDAPRSGTTGTGSTTVKLFDIQQQSSSGLSEGSSSVDGGASSSCSGGATRRPPPQQQSFSLVKLFMKQKSMSNEGVCCAMDASSASECWPASHSAASEGDSGDSFAQEVPTPPTRRSRPPPPPSPAQQKPCCALPDCDCALRTDDINDNNKKTAAALARAWEDAGNGNADNGNKTRSGGGADTTASTDNWIRSEDPAFEDSLAEGARGCVLEEDEEELDEEEDELEEDGSESVEQLSESVSKIDESALDLAASSCGSTDPLSMSGQVPAAPQPTPARAPRLAAAFAHHHNHHHHQRPSLNNNGSVEERVPPQASPLSQTQATQTAAKGATPLINRSAQTLSGSGLGAAGLGLGPGTPVVKVLPPGLSPRLRQLLGERADRPLYVFYPSYALPDLNFLKEKNDTGKVFLVPQRFSPPEKTAAPPAEKPASTRTPRAAAAGTNTGRRGRRPFSCTDVEALRRKGFAHVQDWDSLTVLLPSECRRLLAEMPELEAHLKAARPITEEKPLFCVSPPTSQYQQQTQLQHHHLPQRAPGKASHIARRPRPASCGDTPADVGGALEPKGSSSSTSSTATQPSSGYRGSSTLLLTDSGCQQQTPPSQLNPLFVYRYDSVSSESSFMGAPTPANAKATAAGPPLPKRSISLPTTEAKKTTPTPPRPPLPRGILRKSLEKPNITPTNTTVNVYNCKVHKNQTNSKRYSMFELGGRSPEYPLDNDEKLLLMGGRQSLPPGALGAGEAALARRLAARLHPEKDIDEAEVLGEEEEEDEGVGAEESGEGEGGACPPTPPLPRRGAAEGAELEEGDGGEEDEAGLSLEELLQMSALSALGPAAATAGAQPAWDDASMQKLRLQVSKFLLGQQPATAGAAEVGCGGGRAPNNTPEHHACACGPSAHGCAKKSVSFAERQQQQQQLLQLQQQVQQLQVQPSLAAVPIREEGESSPEGGSSPLSERCRSPQEDVLAHRKELVSAVETAAEQLLRHFASARDRDACAVLGDSSTAPQVAEQLLSRLCPALYAVLGDGLKPHLDTAFGPISNSVWQVVEASAQQGPMTQALNELVLRINGEDVLSEGAMKFNAFVFGLLNVRSLDAWLAYLRTRESVLRRHYHADGDGSAASASSSSGGGGLLAAAAAGVAAPRALVDRLVAALQPLALLPFRLDLLFEARRLHDSLRRLQQLSPQPSPPVVAPTATSPPGGRPWTFRKLVRSIQSSLSQSTDEEGPAWLPPPPMPMPSQQQGQQQPRSPRRAVPASYHETLLLKKALADCEGPHHPKCTGAADPLPDVVDGSGRWPAADARPRLRPRSCAGPTAAPAPAHASANAGPDAAPGFSLVTDLASTVRKRWSGIQLGSKLFQAFDRLAAEDSDEEYTDSLEPTPRPASAGEEAAAVTDPAPAPAATAPPAAMSGGGKFRRLQMKWEMLSGKEAAAAAATAAAAGTNASPPKSPKSPKALRSPKETTPEGNGTGLTGRSKIPRPVTSPVRPSAIPVPAAARRSPASEAAPGAAPAGRPRPASASAPAASKKTGPAAPTPRASRPADRPKPEGGATRPSSLPQRGATRALAARGAGANAAPGRRAASSSQGRAGARVNAPGAGSDAHQQHGPRFVRALNHRLPADSGHLPFNEGERLRVVLEVDNQWLLCCRGDRKGLVPRSAVIGVDSA